METSEIVKQITNSRRKERKAIERKKLLQQRGPEEIAQEDARRKAEQTESNEMFREMRTDCENLLNERGVVAKRGLLRIKYTMLEASISDEQGEEVKVMLIASKIDPASSDIRLVVGEVFGGFITKTESESFIKFERDNSYIVKLVPHAVPRMGIIMEEHKRKPNLKDARQWKEVVDVLKSRINQSSPIEHK